MFFLDWLDRQLLNDFFISRFAIRLLLFKRLLLHISGYIFKELVSIWRSKTLTEIMSEGIFVDVKSLKEWVIERIIIITEREIIPESTTAIAVTEKVLKALTE